MSSTENEGGSSRSGSAPNPSTSKSLATAPSSGAATGGARESPQPTARISSTRNTTSPPSASGTQTADSAKTTRVRTAERTPTASSGRSATSNSTTSTTPTKRSTSAKSPTRGNTRTHEDTGDVLLPNLTGYAGREYELQESTNASGVNIAANSAESPLYMTLPMEHNDWDGQQAFMYQRRLQAQQQQKGLLMILVVILSVLAYTGWMMEQQNARKVAHAQLSLETAIRQFPKDPEMYNTPQGQEWVEQGFRRFNIRNIIIFSSSVVVSFVLMVWHRRRRVEIQRRKSGFFWLFTAGACLVAVSWSAFMVRQSAEADMLRLVRKDPTARAFIYITCMLIVGLLIFFADHVRRKYGRRAQKLERMRQMLGKAHFQALMRRKENERLQRMQQQQKEEDLSNFRIL